MKKWRNGRKMTGEAIISDGSNQTVAKISESAEVIKRQKSNAGA